MAFNYNPDYTPSGANTPTNEYYKKINHVRITKRDCNKQQFFMGAAPFIPPTPTPGAIPPLAPIATPPPSPQATPSQIPTPTQYPILYGPYTASSQGNFFLLLVAQDEVRIGFNIDSDPEPDVIVEPDVIGHDPNLSADTKASISFALTQLGYPPLVQGPYTTTEGTAYWIQGLNTAEAVVGFDLISNTDPDLWLDPQDVGDRQDLTDSEKQQISDKLAVLGYDRILGF